LIQKYKPQRISSRRKKVSGFIIDDEIQIKVGSELIWLWIATETKKGNSRTKHIQREKHVCCRTFYIKSCEKV